MRRGSLDWLANQENTKPSAARPTMRHVVRGAGLRLHVCLGQNRERRPLVMLQELIGGAGDYSPADLRAIAAKLNAIADDAEAQPMGKRSFFRRYRRY